LSDLQTKLFVGFGGKTMAVPHEFTAEAIAEASVDAFRPYNDFLQSGEPYV
jgi:hypothetical protein